MRVASSTQHTQGGEEERVSSDGFSMSIFDIFHLSLIGYPPAHGKSRHGSGSSEEEQSVLARTGIRKCIYISRPRLPPPCFANRRSLFSVEWPEKVVVHW